MMTFKKAAVVPAVAFVALAALVSTGISASAQSQLTNGDTGAQPNSLAFKPHTAKRMRMSKYRPLTVSRRRPRPMVVAAPAPAPAPVAGNIITAPVGAASTLVGLPFQVLGGVFPAGGPRKGGVTAVRYANAGAEQNKIDEGWERPVPVDRSGPIFVVDNGDSMVSPVSFIGAPIQAAGTIAQVPFRIIQAPFGGPAPGTY